MNPTIADRIDRLAAIPTKGSAERAVLLAAVRWVNAEGELWPALANWAGIAGVSVRTLQRVLHRLAARGIVVPVQRSVGGPRRTSRYLIPSLARNRDRSSGLRCPGERPAAPTPTNANPDGASGLEPGRAGRTSPTPATPTPDVRDPKPRHCVGASTMHHPSHQPPTGNAVDVLRSFGISDELLRHPNATPERLAFAAAQAPSKKNPAGWAAACIRKGWEPPPPDAKAQDRASRKARLARFDAMPPEEKAKVIMQAHALFPNLEHFRPDEPAMRGAIAQAMGDDA